MNKIFVSLSSEVHLSLKKPIPHLHTSLQLKINETTQQFVLSYVVPSFKSLINEFIIGEACLNFRFSNPPKKTFYNCEQWAQGDNF